MAPLTAKQRAALPDRCFAYIDSRGERRLPIHDAAHVRNALSRFSQVAFEDDAARDRARQRLLRAAKKHGIMPIGFVSAQLEPQRKLPKGDVTFLLTDIEGSTALLHVLGDAYADVLADLRRLQRAAVRGARGHVVSARGDDVFAVFERAEAAVDAALAIQREMLERDWPDDQDVRLRIGLHRGRPSLTETGYVGISVHAAARICFSAHGGQIVMSAAVRGALADDLPEGVGLRGIGAWRFRGLPEAVELFEVEADGLLGDFEPPRAAAQAHAAGLGQPALEDLDQLARGLLGDEMTARQTLALDLAGPASPHRQRTVVRSEPLVELAPEHQRRALDLASLPAILRIELAVEIEAGAIVGAGGGDRLVAEGIHVACSASAGMRSGKRSPVADDRAHVVLARPLDQALGEGRGLGQ